MKRSNLSLLFALTLAVSACKTNNTGGGGTPPPPDDNEAVSESTESVADSIQEILDDVDPGDSGSSKTADASTLSLCRALFLQPCNAGVRSADYDRCRLLFRGSVSGHAELRYSDAACRLNDIGDSVNRIAELTFTSVRGQLQVSTGSHQDYRGVTIGGGSESTRAENGWDVNLLGQRRILKGTLGRLRHDISLITLEPLKARGRWRDNNRSLESGILEVNHNLARYSAKYTVNGLKYDNQCCYPVAGSIDVLFSGSVNAAGTVEFQGCGKAQWTNGAGVTRDLALNACEYK